VPDAFAFLFPGQGQLPADVPTLSPELARLYEIVEAQGMEIRDWIGRGDVARLSTTEVAQPAVLLDSLARCDALRRRGVEAHAVAGHSLGEYAALVAAGVLSAASALALVTRRGRLMAGVPGGMAALLKLDLETVTRICAAGDGRLVIANYNGPAQFVVSGPLDALADVERRATECGGRAVRLAVSGPFHSPFMRPAEESLAPFIAQTLFAAPTLPFVSSVSGRVEADAEAVRRLLASQITSAVRWTDVLRTLADLGVTDAIEVGAGNVLTQLGKRAESVIRFHSFEEVFHAGV
jgi:[acyl-carrier-protein] S-malonyltransferase